MTTPENIAAKLTGSSVLEELKSFLREYDPLFCQKEARSISAAHSIRKLLQVAELSDFEAYLAANDRQIIAQILYAGHLGYMANLDHFRSPTGFNLATADLPFLLKEHVMYAMPDYRTACAESEELRRRLPDAIAPHLESVSHFYSWLDVAAPKLAHYAGYRLANELLPWTEPGYVPDRAQTCQYKMILWKHLGLDPFPASLPCL